MGAELSKLEAEVLSFLIKRANGKDEVQFKVGEALQELRISREELDEVLLKLEGKGLVKVIRIPPSQRIVREIERKLIDLDASFVAGELSYEEYLRRRNEAIAILSSMPSELERLTPLPPSPVVNAIEGLENSLAYLKRLSEHKGSLNPLVLEKLRETYKEILLDSSHVLDRYADAISFFSEKMSREAEKLRVELEALSVDEKVRGVDFSAARSERLRKLEEIKGKVERVVRAVSYGSTAVPPPSEDAEKLARELEQLKLLLETLNARILIEGPSDRLVRMRNEVEGRIRELEELQRRARAAAEQQGRKVEAELDRLLEELKELRSLELVEENVFQPVAETLAKFKSVYERLTNLLEEVTRILGGSSGHILK